MMAGRQVAADRKRVKKPKKERSYKGKAVLWIFLFMIVDEVTPGIPLAEAIQLAILVFLPRWFLEVVHRVYEYMPHRQSWHTVGDICKREVMAVAPDARAIDVARLMREEHVRSLIVVETRPDLPPPEGVEKAGKRGKEKESAAVRVIRVPVGILTDRDLALRVEGRGLSWEVPVAEIMTPNPMVAAESEEVHRVVEKMRAMGVRQFPVVDRHGALIGTLSLEDTIAMLSNSLDDMVELLQREIQKEAEISG